MSDTIKIELEVNLDELKDIINDTKELNDNEQLFSQLVQFQRVKKQISEISDQLTSIETEAKSYIKAKADALYGKEWTAIKGTKGKNYKITKSPTGSVFNIMTDKKPPKEFLVIKESLDTELVENFIKEKGVLPKGIEYNPSRGTSIRITVADNEDN